MEREGGDVAETVSVLDMRSMMGEPGVWRVVGGGTSSADR